MLESESASVFIAGQAPYLAPLMCVKLPYLVPPLITRLSPDHAAFNSHCRGALFGTDLIMPLSIDRDFPSLAVLYLAVPNKGLGSL